MEIINNPDSVSGDPIREIYDSASGYNSTKVGAIRKELDIEVGMDFVKVAGITLPAAFQKLLGNIETKQDALSIVAFAKDLAQNPGEHCKEALIEWLVTNPSLSFTPDGKIIGYRAVDENFASNHKGYGIVNGKEVENDHLDNTPGNTLQFPRFMVDQNPNKHCSIGLHVGTWDYATSYASSFPHGTANLISVAFKASDVVSPPEDAHQEKIRVEEYTVREVVQAPYKETIVGQN